MAKRGVIKGAIILSAAGIVCRLLGVLFRIPLSNIVGNYGIGLYQLVFPLYSLLLIISSAGIPVALSKMIARVCEQQQQAKRIFVNALLALLIIGAIITVLFFALARPIAAWQGKAEIWPLYMAIAPAISFVCVISAYRGYFQGLNNMIPTAISQIVEQSIKVVAGLGLSFWLIRYGILWSVFGAILAVAISELTATVLLVVVYHVHTRRVEQISVKANCERLLSWNIIQQIFRIAAPIMVMSLAFPVVQLFDSFYIVNALKHNGVGQATELYGIATGAVHTLINLPSVVGVALATVMLPAVSRSFKQGNLKMMHRRVWLALGFMTLFGFGIVVGLNLLPRWILNLLYHRAFANHPDELSTAVLLLRIESWAVILIGLTQIIGSILQGMDYEKVPMWALIVGGAVKIVFEIIALKQLGIMAVSIANLLCFSVATMISGSVLIKLMLQRK